MAEPADAAEIGRLLDDFNTEFDTPTQGAAFMAERTAGLIEAREIDVLLGEIGEAARPAGIAVFRRRPGLWSSAYEGHLQELYVEPDRRGQGLGKALLEAVLELARERGCSGIDLGTEESDVAARGLYESYGFTNVDDGDLMFFYERDL